MDDAMDISTDTTNDEILLAATNHDLPALRSLLRNGGSAQIQDPDTGFSPLHAAIASCEADDDDDLTKNGEGDALHSLALSEESALETVKFLLENGAVWNELDNDDETPGCMALRLGVKTVYDELVSAGVRAELLFGRLDAFALLPDDDDEEEEEEEEDNAIIGFEPAPPADHRGANGSVGTNTPQKVEGFEPAPNPSYKIDEENPIPSLTQTSPNGEETAPTQPIQTNANVNTNNNSYLASTLTYSRDRLMDSDSNAVMMDWETEIMSISAAQLTPTTGLRTMNVGHGMGIVDRMFLAREPAMHHIVEAHPEVLARLRETGWYEKPNVTIHEGRWQDVLPALIAKGEVLDGIYYDTYAEDYKDLKVFFAEYVVALLDAKGLFRFYNGLGADRQVCYDVYTKVVEVDLFDAGLEVVWTDVAVPDLNGKGEWEGVRYPYWNVEMYRLPTCRFVG